MENMTLDLHDLSWVVIAGILFAIVRVYTILDNALKEEKTHHGR
jgi:hypothetical protein